jgi:hypothetical protein
MEYGDNHLHDKLKASTLSLIALLLLLLTLSSAFGLQITSPNSVQEGQSLVVSATGSGTVTIERNGITMATGASSATNTFATDSTSAGIYAYTFSDANATETRNIEVIDVPLVVNILTPATADVAANDVTFSLSTNLAPELCYVNIDSVSHTLTSTSPTTFSGTFAMSEGVHALEYKCKLGTELAVATRTVHVDTSAPVITGSAPSGEVTGPYLTLTVNTDEIAQCRYGGSDAQYSALPNIMSTTYALKNTATVYAPAYGSYTYFVRCVDVNGNAMSTPTIISFLNNVPPSAEITIDGKEPLRAETYHITLKSSVPLADMPVLTYNLQESGKQQQVALTGEGDTWSGFLVVPAGIADTVVGFSFGGTSLQGIRGTQITHGALFTIDASPPRAIDAISVDNTSGKIKLKWFSANAEDGIAYNIYRADHESVSYTDYYASTRLTEYTDSHPYGARYFYYRVASVDEAGNIGPLSMEVYGSAIDGDIETTQSLDPLVTAKLDEEIASITSGLLDVNSTLKTLEQEPNPVNIRIINEMHLIDKSKDARQKMESAISILQELRGRSPSAEEADAGIVQARQLTSDARHLLTRKIFAREQTETKQATNSAGVERLLPYALLGQNISSSQRAKYLEQSVKLQDSITVTLNAITFTLYDGNGRDQDYTLIRRTIVSQNPQSDITLIESIPKTVAEDASDLEFSREPVVLESDPVVQFQHGVLEREEYTYVIKRLVSLSDVKSAEVYAYAKAEVAPVASPDLLTGNATRIGLPKGNDVVLILIGAIIIVGLGAYYVSLAKEPKPFKMSVQRKPAPVARARIVHAPLQASAASPENAEVVLQQALAAINEKHYDAALLLYTKAIDLQKHDPGLQHMLEEESLRVYNKLLLFKRLTDARHAADTKDHTGLRRALEEVRALSKSIGNESTLLMTEAKASYANFVRVLNMLEIERAGKY